MALATPALRCGPGVDHLNPHDYEFYELHPDEEVTNDAECLDSLCNCNLPWNEMKEAIRGMDNKEILSDSDFIKNMKDSFFDKVKDAKYSVIQNAVTGEYIFPMAPFRGNKAYSRKKRKRIQPIIDAFGDKEISRPVRGSRPSEVRQVHAMMITLSFTRNYSKEEHTRQGFPIKKWNSFDAWESITPLVNQFKVELSRIIGKQNGEKGKQISYGSCLVKEGCADMYPAPHLVILFDKPILSHRYKKQWLLGGRSDDRSLVNSVQAIWERIAGSHCKINAIISAGGLAYVFKYVTKSIDLNIENLDRMTHDQAICFNTHLNQSLHNQNDIISKKFLEKLDYIRELTLLDYIRKKLKQTKAELKKLSKEIEEKGGFNAFTFSIHPHLKQYWSLPGELERLKEEAYHVKMATSPWFYISGGFSSIESAIQNITENNKSVQIDYLRVLRAKGCYIKEINQRSIHNVHYDIRFQ